MKLQRLFLPLAWAAVWIFSLEGGAMAQGAAERKAPKSAQLPQSVKSPHMTNKNASKNPSRGASAAGKTRTTVAQAAPASKAPSTSGAASSHSPAAKTSGASSPAAPPSPLPAASGPPSAAGAPASSIPSSASMLGVVRPVPVYQKTMIAVPFFDVKQGLRFEPESIPRIIRRDLELSGYFTLSDLTATNRQNMTDVQKQTIQWDRWEKMRVELYLMGSCEPGGAPGELIVDTLLYDINSKNRVFGKQFKGTSEGYRSLAHQVADEIVRYVKGMEGISQTRIAYVTDRTGQRIKEIAVMDYDGFGQNAAPLTRHGKLCVRPCWGAHGAEIYFTSYRDFNPDLYGLSLQGGKEWHISRKPGLNTLAGWCEPLGKIVMVLAKDGNNELYTCTRSGGDLKRLTQTKTIESSPCWSPDGSEIAFVSDREGGHPQIYVMNANGSNVRRLTRQGAWNDAPTWSPKGDRIAFVSRIEGKFDIFSCSPSGENGSWRRLTINSGDNETPTWAPDGRHLAFASNRGGSWQIYIMLDDGSNQQQVTTLGNNQQPSWGPARK